MNIPSQKVMTMDEAIHRYVFDGCHISFGGFTINRNPMAATHEIIRQRIKGLHVYAHSNGQAIDELVGASCVSKLEVAYAGTGLFAPTCIRFMNAVKKGRIEVEDYSNFQMTLRFLAGALGVPFLPTKSGLGSDIIDHWGFPEAARKKDPKIPDKKLVVADNPFGSWMDTRKVVLVPAIQTDITIVHAQTADKHGTTKIDGLLFADVEQIKSARHVIVTCEKLVDSDELRESSDLIKIPPFCVDAVVCVPYGAYPTACYGYYDYDPKFLKEYAAYAETDASFQSYLDTFIFGVEDHAALLKYVGGERLDLIKADPRTGYAVGLDRK
jgi:glutaconate CoA-transferase subunit A